MSQQTAVETAWKTHDAINGWTSNVDSKASFALSLESAVLGAVFVVSGTDGRLGAIRPTWPLFCYRMGVAVLVLSVLASLAAVIPQIRAGGARREHNKNFIFFGHLRYWSHEELAEKLVESDPLPVLSRQLVEMSKIAWTKHRLLQVSLAAAPVGSALVFLSVQLH